MSDTEHRKFLLKHAYRLSDDFPLQFAGIQKLVQRICTVDDEAFRFELGEIIYLHRKRR